MKKIISFSKERLLLLLYVVVISVGLIRTYNSGALAVYSPPTGKKIVLIDAGHGGWDPGKLGEGGTVESEINLKIAEKLQAFLEISGSFVVTTRAEDVSLGDTKRGDLLGRKTMSEESGADILISIHQNSFPQREVKGAQTFYYGESEKSKRLAELIQSELRDSADYENRREAKPNLDYYILKYTDIPAVIVECGFLSNPEEAECLTDEDYQNKIAWAIYLGIVKYFDGGSTE